MRIKDLTKQGIVAAVYVVVSLALSPLSYGAIQFRFAETLKVLPFYNKKFTVGLTLGCFIVNLFSPMGIVDAVFGTTATLITCILASCVKRIGYIPPVTAIVTGLIVGAELYFVLGLPFIPSVISVTLGEFVVVLVGAVGMSMLSKNKVVKMLLS